jgi:glucosamine--fructose-6-phosphate aminotransferase (isomerizing)
MNTEEKYMKFDLVKEMMETPKIVADFKLENTDKVIARIKEKNAIFFTGEGSSRIFPAKNAMMHSLQEGTSINLATEGGYQAAEYDLSNFVVFGASNSGQTKEVIGLFDKLKKAGNPDRFGLTANHDTKLESLSEQTFVISCGKEDAVAATKSVAEQALFYQALMAKIQGKCFADKLSGLGDAIEAALTVDIDPAITKAIAGAGTIHFAGRNDGVAEELTLKTNEITRKKSDYLEGTYLVHGVEEVMNADDVVILIDPFESELASIEKLIEKAVGCTVIAVSTAKTIFPTILVKDCGALTNYAYLAAGWNILVEVGISLGIDLDKPERARKVGNEFVE